MNLIIVESPTKAKTISQMLGKEYKIESSFGHVRDLPKSKIGIDIEKNFEPQYIIPVKSKKRVAELKKLAEKSDKIILATDEDREGEAIAWHLTRALGLDAMQNSKFQISNFKKNANRKPQTANPIVERIVFHEITKKAIENALSNPRQIDENLVDAQQARRILDRLVGYKLSPFLWKKVMSRLSAGRVQSVALRFIVDREREILAFKPQKYFSVEAVLKKEKGDVQEFIAVLRSVEKKPVEKPGILERETAERIVSDLKKADWSVLSADKKEKIKRPSPPFTTSSLQQSAWNFYKFSAKKTMLAAQQLYEGIDIKGRGRAGLITYMRTDSLNISEEALSAAKKSISENFGAAYALDSPRRFKTKSKGAQEAHEAVRPTDAGLRPEEIKSFLTEDQYKLYKLIWQRFLASQAKEAVFMETDAEILAKAQRKYYFRSRGLQTKFDGFLKIYPLKIEEEILPSLSRGERLAAKNIAANEHETKPPPRYNEASLIKLLEKHGIGRPSTYAPTLSTIQERGYVIKNSGKALEPTETGFKTTDLLKEHFSDIVDAEFTAKMEENLDEIAEGEKDWRPMIKEFYVPFEKNLEQKYKEVKDKVMTYEETNEKCEKCGKTMIIKMGRFGKFMACSGFPECKSVKPLPREPLGKCEKCGQGDIVERKTKKGRRIFYGCSRYPECDFSSWEKPKTEV